MIVSSSWGIMTAQHQLFAQVTRSLTSYGVEHFIPMIESINVVRGRHVTEPKPLLGEYIPFAVSQIWKSLLSIRGVTGILLNESGQPAQVLPHELKRLRDMCDENGIYRSAKTIEGFTYGQRVTPKEGPFAYHVGRFESKNKRGDLAALFSLFGREQRVVFKPGDLIVV